MVNWKWHEFGPKTSMECVSIPYLFFVGSRPDGVILFCGTELTQLRHNRTKYTLTLSLFFIMFMNSIRSGSNKNRPQVLHDITYAEYNSGLQPVIHISREGKADENFYMCQYLDTPKDLINNYY